MPAYEKAIRAKITEFVVGGERNSMPAHCGMTIYDAPLIGFASASDQLFGDMKAPRVLGSQFIPPNEWLSSATAVISFFLPFTKEVRESNRATGMVSEEWVSARIDGEAFINELKEFVTDFLRGEGCEALAPSLDPRFRVVTPPDGGCGVSNWSERHVAYVAGLGTFGLHRGLITEKGTAGRFGSVVTSLGLASTERAYRGAFDYCPYIVNGKCGSCINRCPVSAITPRGKDKVVCSRYIDTEIKPRFAPRYGCAKCNIAVPCEARIPGF